MQLQLRVALWTRRVMEGGKTTMDNKKVANYELDKLARQAWKEEYDRIQPQ